MKCLRSAFSVDILKGTEASTEAEDFAGRFVHGRMNRPSLDQRGKVMRISSLAHLFLLLYLSFFLACGSDETLQEEASDTSLRTVSATIVGTIANGGAAAQGIFQPADAHCPEVIVMLNGSPADIIFDEDCAFLITDVEPSETVVLRIELPDQGISGTIELEDVVEGELIEILVEVGFNSLAIAVVRREEPEPADGLPEVITENKVTIFLPTGVYERNLTVDGNKFTLVGEAGSSCDEDDLEDWTVIQGEVVINKNKATFRNIAFEGPVEVRGNNAQFIHCCFDGILILFGNNTDIDD